MIFLVTVSVESSVTVSVESTTNAAQENQRFICPLACYAYNYGGHHSFPRRDIWCKCHISVYGLSHQEIAQLPPVTGAPPLLESEMTTGLMKVLVSLVIFCDKSSREKLIFLTHNLNFFFTV